MISCAAFLGPNAERALIVTMDSRIHPAHRWADQIEFSKEGSLLIDLFTCASADDRLLSVYVIPSSTLPRVPLTRLVQQPDRRNRPNARNVSSRWRLIRLVTPVVRL